jgi:oxygen-independent coproporphyrinogen-3 oxidase
LAGIYLHIPFCKQACHYCNFHFSTSTRYKNELVNALLKETGLQKEYLAGEVVETIYFGGGTPSLLAAEDLGRLVANIRSAYTVHPGAEVTLEANPDDIGEDRLLAWKSAGINRLSLGIQSFFEEDLQWMNRAHTAVEATKGLQMALAYFDNITIDLIYGIPGMTAERWNQNVETAIGFGVPHLSCYALTVEEKTPLQKMIRLGKSGGTDPDLQSEQFFLLMEWMEKAGYEHYEISNFARPGWRSRHNSSYWQGKNYLGLGPSAHSFNGKSRQWNVANNQQYIAAIESGRLPFEKEVLNPVQQLNEYIMTALRTSEGINLLRVDQVAAENLLSRSETFVGRGLLRRDNDRLTLTREGKLLADGIAADLFFDQ